jgi:hypothetical protein
VPLDELEAAAHTRTEAKAGSEAEPSTAISLADPFPAAPLPVLGNEAEEVPALEPPRVAASGAPETPADPAAAGPGGPPAPPAASEIPAPSPPGGALPKLEPTPPSSESGPEPGGSGLTVAPDAADRPPADSSLSQAVRPAESDPNSSGTDADSSPPAPSAGNWPALRTRLAEAGVARYWIEGEPTGRVRIRCVVPLAGETAVGQQFEAEADTEAHAAELALRRITLWHAAEAP